MPTDDRISLEQLLSVPVPLTVEDAVAVIAQLARSPQTGRPTGARLSLAHVWLERDGAVRIAPGILPTRAEVGALLQLLLSVIHEMQPGCVPHSLCLVVAHAAGQLDSATMPSLTAFAAALQPFQPADPAGAVAAIVAAAGNSRVQSRPLPTTPMPAAASPPALPPTPEALPLTPRGDEPRGRPRRRWRAVAVATLAASVLAALIGARIARDLAPPVLPEAAASDVLPISISTEAGTPPIDAVAAVAPSTLAPSIAGPAAPSTSAPSIGGPAAPPTPVPPSGRRPTAPTPATTPTIEPLIDGDAVRADAVFSPSFASHGSAVFFHAQTAEGSALKRAEPGERGELRVATIVDDGARNHHVQLSPSGTTLAFDSDRDGVRGVYVASAEGRDVRRVSGPGYAAVPTWSPDGRRLAFIRGEEAKPAVWNLWLLDLASGRQTRVTAFRHGQVWGGAWFNDGRRIAFSHEDGLTIHDLDSGESRRFASPLPGRLVRTPAVSPDGRWIVFQVFRDGAWLLDLDRGFMQRVMQDPSAEEFTWSPDGRRVAFHSRRSGGWCLWTMSAP